MSLTRTVRVSGKELLINAALKLAAKSRSLQALGLRELAREAGLNPNTFYRHFASLDDLGLTMIERLVVQLRGPLRQQRIAAAQAVIDQYGAENVSARTRAGTVRGLRVNRETVRLFFDFVVKNQYGFIIGLRELHGASPVIRQALSNAMENFAADMADDLERFQLMPVHDRRRLEQASILVVRQMFMLSMDYIEQPERRQALRRETEDMIMAVIMGYSALDELPRSPEAPGTE
ncbi:MAG: TetR family transcriptional regulator [Halomonadaceae bacterium]|nr:MAG: TetR family transcriptional regulator [Halomonadaceae bacterium]